LHCISFGITPAATPRCANAERSPRTAAIAMVAWGTWFKATAKRLW
jgi:hypothetical protein